jgi:NADH-quinone oxidoreductase chain G
MSENATVTLTIDDREITVPADWTVYQAATAAGIHIPTFCHHEKLVPVGACRQCLVEIEGVVSLQTSCTTPVRDGMVVRAWTSPQAVEARKAVIEFLLTNHPLDCPICDKGGECPLQDQALADGPGRSRYIEEKRHKLKRYPLSDFIVIDQERCVLCWRCIRFLEEWADDHELDLFGRGADTRLETFHARPMQSKWQGNTIDICPVGALTSRIFRFEARPWELDSEPSVCPLCAVGCNLELWVKNNRLCRVTPRENMAVNDAWLCDRGRFGHAFVDHPDRLQTPLVRRDNHLEPATWPEALERVARGLREAVAAGGPGAVAGIGSSHATNEASYLFQRLLRGVVGTNNVDHAGRVPLTADLLSSLPSLERADVVLLLGFDPSTEAPLVELWLKKAILRHRGRIVVANPWRIELSRYGGPFLGYRPPAGVALANGLARAVMQADAERGATRGVNVEDVLHWLDAYRPDQVERLAGTPAAALEEAGRLLARAERPLILYGPNWLAHAAGHVPTGQISAGSARGGERAEVVPSLAVVANLSLLLGDAGTVYIPRDANAAGALQMGVVPDLFPGRQPLDDRDARSRLASFWGGGLSADAGMDLAGMMDAIRTGTLGALWVMGADPARQEPGAAGLLRQVPFLVVQDLFLTETAAVADVVLPSASFAETDGTLTNMTGRVQALHAGRRPPGQAWPDWRILVAAARHMADQKQQRAWDFAGPGDVLREIARAVPGYDGIDWAALEDEGWQSPVAAAGARERRRRGFTRIEVEGGGEDPDYPFRLATGPLFYDRGPHLKWSEILDAVVPAPFVMIHPADAQRAGAGDGDTVTLLSPAGRVERVLQVSDRVMPGVLFAPLEMGGAPLSTLAEEPGILPRVRIDT